MDSYADVFERMATAAPALAQSTAAERLDRIHALYTAAYEHRADIAEATSAELGGEGRTQLVPFKAMLADFDVGLEEWMRPVEVADGPALNGRRAYVLWEPKGVVLHLATWNVPVLSSLSPVMSMLAAGNTVVLKPSEIAPISSAVVRRIVETSGQTDVISVVEGGPDVGQALLELPFNHITYVGSNRIGRIIMKAAAEHFAGVTLEMGGKNPVIVGAHADVDDAAKRIVHGRHILTGQACLCPDYVMIDAALYEETVDALRRTIVAFYDPAGVGSDKSSALGRIVSEHHARRIESLIADAVAKGATVLEGGQVDAAKRFVAPTLLEGVTDAMDLFHEEVFGPVLTVHRFESPGDAIAEIDKRPKPLGCYVFSQDRDEVDWFLRHTRAGSSAVNGIATQALVPNLPFGGVNHSGLGQLNGYAAFREYSNGRGVVEDALEPEDRAGQFYPPYPDGFDLGAMIEPLVKPEVRV